ncbi:fimbrial biogenesis outer membrane usher protein [Acinetobacter baumannii]
MKNRTQLKCTNVPFRLLVLCCAIQQVHASDEFNTAFLNGQTDKASLEAVEQGYAILPGIYSFAIHINQEKVDQRELRFDKNVKNEVVPCLDAKFLKDYGVLWNASEQHAQDAGTCLDITQLIPNATLSFDAGLQRLDLSIPQVNLTYQPRGYIPPKLYNQGMNAVLLNYNINGTYSTFNNRSDYGYLSALLNGGFNLGAWRYRNQSNYIQQSHSKDRWQTISNRLERDILPWRSRLEIGDSYTNSDVFDSYGFRGVQLSSDDQQLPYSLQNFAPVIRGVAVTNARVEVRQNGYVIYTTNVAAGAFEIQDLISATDSGDLEVRVIESDGRIKTFFQPYSAVPKMLRKGIWKYQLTAGQYRSSGTSDNYRPSFVQATVARGMNNVITPYVGVLAAEDYFSGGAGVGLSLGKLGAISTDVTMSNNQLAAGGSATGASLRFLYSKSLNQFGTNLKIVGYRYSSRNFFDLADAVAEKAQWKNGQYEYSYYLPNSNASDPLTEEQRLRYAYSTRYYNKKNQLQIALNQNLGKYGQFYVNVSNQDFWNSELSQRSWQVGYNTYIQRASVGVFYQDSKTQFASSDYSVGLNVTIPLGKDKKNPHDLTSTSSYQYNDGTGYALQTGVSGNFLADKNLQLQAQVGYSEQNDQNLYLNAAYQGAKVNAGLGYSVGSNYQQMAANLSGGILVHSGGMTFGRPLNSNPILVEAKGATGVGVENQTGLKIDRNGYAIINGSSAYRRNRVALRAEDMPSTMNIDQLVVRDIVPTKNAVVKVKFDVVNGQNILASLKTADQQPLTLGAVIYNADKKNIGLVGLDGSAYITGAKPQETLVAKWGDDASEQCHFTLPALQPVNNGYAEAELNCVQ